MQFPAQFTKRTWHMVRGLVRLGLSFDAQHRDALGLERKLLAGVCSEAGVAAGGLAARCKVETAEQAPPLRAAGGRH